MTNAVVDGRGGRIASGLELLNHREAGPEGGVVVLGTKQHVDRGAGQLGVFAQDTIRIEGEVGCQSWTITKQGMRGPFVGGIVGGRTAA